MDDFAFEPLEPDTRAPAPAPAVPVHPVASAGIAYITVTDAAGRVLFRRPATKNEVDEALLSAEEAENEGQAAMDRIAFERLFEESMGDLA